MTASTPLQRTTAAQRQAADPAASVWVSANAGTGKTHVLTNRVLRLLLDGTLPERILCLTYTKAAAAEMSKRVFEKLAEWVAISDADLERALAALIGRPASVAERQRARTLFASAIETPGGLKVQTIHAFCERLLQRFPLEAGVPPGFTILDDPTAAELLREATDAMLAAATRDEQSMLGKALQTAIAHAAEDSFDTLLLAALRQRDWLEAAVRMEADPRATGFKAAGEVYRRLLGIGPNASRQGIEAEMAAVLSDSDVASLRDALMAGSATDQKAAAHLSAASDAAGVGARLAALTAFFLTAEGAERARLMTKSVSEARPELDQRAKVAQRRFAGLDRERLALSVFEATMALLILAEDVMQRYGAVKARRAALDFDDLIRFTASLLSQANGSAPWVLFKLDGGLDHILVDESQDTSPNQWRVVEALAEEFFADTGAGRRDKPRTLFAVGDEKQSIYSFQGAAPELFAAKGRSFAELAQASGQIWRNIPLNLSFRTVTPILDAVDLVFADPQRTPGVGAGMTSLRHEAKRHDQSGLVEIWETETPVPQDATDAWSPLGERMPPTPAERLAERIASTIRCWLDTGEVLTSEDRPLTAGDILILVRKRRPFADVMVQALERHKIPVAGADRIALTDQIAVQDLMVLGDFLTLPEDDLALATVLKSPLFGCDDDDLLALAAGRKGTLWKSLLDAAAGGGSQRLVDAAETLKRWRKQADFAPPFEFYARLLDIEGVRGKLLDRLGAEAADAIDEFLSFAMAYDDDAPPSLSGFLAELRSAAREIKRDMDVGRDEVRVMTVHGAKGLEAPVVFLPDTCSTASAGGGAGSLLVADDAAFRLQHALPFLWPLKGARRLAMVDDARKRSAARETEERNRLLYVAMTRARDRLYVAGFEGVKPRSAGCWYDLIRAGLEGRLDRHELAGGQVVHRLANKQLGPHDVAKAGRSAAIRATEPEVWARRPAPREAQLAVPLAPSSLAPYDQDHEGEPLPAPPRPAGAVKPEPPVVQPARSGEDNRFLRGTITHALLEHLPQIDVAARPAAAKGFVAKRAAGLSARAQASIVAETLAILATPKFAPLFAPGSRAEVPLVAMIPRPAFAKSGPPLRLSGQIDRLAVTDQEVLIVDYKTNRPPPRHLENVPETYLLQLAAYTLALRQIYADRRIGSAIIWTDGPHMMEIPDHTIEAAITRLWRLEPGART